MFHDPSPPWEPFAYAPGTHVVLVSAISLFLICSRVGVGGGLGGGGVRHAYEFAARAGSGVGVDCFSRSHEATKTNMLSHARTIATF